MAEFNCLVDLCKLRGAFDPELTEISGEYERVGFEFRLALDDVFNAPWLFHLEYNESIELAIVG